MLLLGMRGEIFFTPTTPQPLLQSKILNHLPKVVTLSMRFGLDKGGHYNTLIL